MQLQTAVASVGFASRQLADATAEVTKVELKDAILPSHLAVALIRWRLYFDAKADVAEDSLTNFNQRLRIGGLCHIQPCITKV